jgi:hypothetical protein
MSFFCHQVSYTTDARNRLLHDPCDLLVISEFPDDVSPASISVAFSHGGAIANIRTIPLLPLAEARDIAPASAPPSRPPRASSALAATAGR